MNFKVNLFFFYLYRIHITPLGIPIPTVPRVTDGVGKGGVIMGKKQVCSKCSTGKIKDPPSQLNGKFHKLFFLKKAYAKLNKNEFNQNQPNCV